MIAAYWGRFNPPHKGHMNQVRKILRESEFLVIVIGSAEFRNTKRNPFDGKEKSMMMRAYLKDEKINLKKIKIIAVPDGKSYNSAVRNLFKFSPKFDVLYADKESVIRLVKGRAKIRRIVRTGSLSSTKIRDAIASGGKWEHMTGKSVARIIRELHGIERIKKAYQRAAGSNQAVFFLLSAQ